MTTAQNKNLEILKMWEEVFELNYKQDLFRNLESKLKLFKKELNLNDAEISFICCICNFKNKSVNEANEKTGVDIETYFIEQEESLKEKGYLKKIVEIDEVMQREYTSYDFGELEKKLKKLTKEYFQIISDRVDALENKMKELEKELKEDSDYVSNTIN